MCRRLISVLAVIASTLFAQDFIASGTSIPLRIPIWPGLITTLYVSTDLDIAPITVASGFPLPRSLAGLTVELWSGGTPAPLLVPILHVRRFSLCPDSRAFPQPCGSLAAVTIQVPWEIVTGLTGYQIAILQNGKRGKAVDADTSYRALRFVTRVDPAVVSLPGTSFFSGPSFVHADGTAVTPSSPAISGEVIIGFLFGLGRTTLPVATGEASPPGAELFSRDFFYYEFRPTQRPLNPARLEDAEYPQLNVLWLGLTPGSVGLYQINFQVPPVPRDLKLCYREDAGVRGNMTISYYPQLFDVTVSICVVPAP